MYSNHDAVAVLKWHGQADRVLQDADWTLDDRDDSTNQLQVSTSLAEADGIRVEQELIFKNRRFIVSEPVRTRSNDRAVIVADEAQVELGGRILLDFEFNSWTAFQALEWALKDTRWSPGEVQNVRYGRAHFEDITVLEACHFLARHQDSVVTFDSLRRRVNLTATRGTVHEMVFTYGRQLRNIEKTEKAPATTRIWPTGADDMTIASVNSGVEFVEDFSYYTSQGISLADARTAYMKEDYWEDNRYEVPENMHRDALDRLKTEAHPKITYTLTAMPTCTDDGIEDLSLPEVGLGDRVYVWDDEIDAKLMAEVAAVMTSSDRGTNEITLSYLPPSLGHGSGTGGGRYFGDSGSTAGGPSYPRSGFQPRPSMPILEDLSSLGVAVVRWNGQNHDGNYDTIPVRFGSVIPRAVRIPESGVIPSPESDAAFEGTRITSRGGGMSTITFGAPGEYAVWFYMLGRDQETTSEYSQALVVDVTALVDVDQIEADLQAARGEWEQAHQEFEQGQQQLDDRLDNLNDEVIPGIREDLTTGLDDARDELQDLDYQLRDHFGTRLDNAIAAILAGGQTWSQNEMPPAGTTYEWTGTPHNSRSTKKNNGTITAHNDILNPSFEESRAGWDALPAGDFTAFGVVPQTPYAGDSSLKVRVADGAGAFSYIRYGEIPVTGDYVAWTARARGFSGLGAGLRLWLRPQWRVSGSWTTSAFHDVTLPLVVGEYAEQHMVFQVPSGATDVRFLAYPRAGDGSSNPAPGGATFRVDGWHVAQAGTADDALDQVSTYFDGDTLDDRANDVWINGEGTQHRWDSNTKQWTAFTNEQIQQAIDTLTAQVDTVMGIAGSKNSVIYDTGAPSADGVAPGDIWRQRSANGDVTARWYWTGTRWQLEKITNEVIDNLDAGKITAGTATIDQGFIQKLMVDGLTARIATLAQAVVATQNLIPGMQSITERMPPPFDGRGFGLNTGDPSIWIQGRTTISTDPDAPIWLEAGEPYVFKTDAKSSISGTRYYIQLIGGGSVTVDGTSTSYLISNRLASTPWHSVEAEFTVSETGPYRLNFYANHQNGTDNPDGYQWWRGLSVHHKMDGSLIAENSVTTAALNTLEIFSDSAVINEIWARAVRAKMIESNEAFIGGALIKNQQITVNHLVGLESILTELLRAKKIEAGDIDANAINGMTIKGGLIEGGRIESAQVHSAEFHGGTYRGGHMIGTRIETSQHPSRGVKLDDGGYLFAYNNRGELTATIGGPYNRLAGRLATGVGDQPGIILNPTEDDASGRTGMWFVPRVGDGIGGSDTAGVWVPGPNPTYGQDLYLRGHMGGGVTVAGRIRATTGTSLFNVIRHGSDGYLIQAANGSYFEGETNFRGQLRNTGRTPTGQAANVHMDSNGRFWARSSTGQHKLDQQVMEVSDDLLELDLKTWIDKPLYDEKQDAYERLFNGEELEELDRDTLDAPLPRTPGVIGEELAAIDDRFVVFDEHGEVSDVQYERLALAWIPIVRRQKQRIEQQQHQIDDLEARLAALEERLN